MEGKFKSDAAEAMHSAVVGMRRAGTIDEATMLRFDEMCLYRMSSLWPGNTGLPMTVWASVRGSEAEHECRVLVAQAHGNQADPVGCAVVSVRPQAALVEGTLDADDEPAVLAWVAANAQALVDHWDGRIDVAGLARRLVGRP